MPLNYPYYTPTYTPPYTPYGAQTQQNINQPIPNMQTQNNVNTGIIWVQGEAGAKSYLVGAGNSVLLMDSEQSRFYIKSTDGSGMPMPLRVFEYNELSSNSEPKVSDNSKYVTHDELERRLQEFDSKPIAKKEAKTDAKSTV